MLETLVPYEREVRTTGGAWYLARIQPYRTLDNVIEGVVLTFVPLTEMKQAQEALRAGAGTGRRASSIRCASRSSCWMAPCGSSPPAGRFTSAFNVTPEETVGRRLYELGEPASGTSPRCGNFWRPSCRASVSFDGYEVEHDFPVIGPCTMLLSARRIVGKTGDTQLILLAMEMTRPRE